MQRELLEAVAGCGKPVILCMLSGSAIDMQYASEHVNAILQVWYPGARGGKAAADLLFGACSPSGKLPLTFYRDLEDFPEFTDYSMTGKTYRYVEKEPLYPFGYGLTYGDVIVKEAGLAGNLSRDAAAEYAENSFEIKAVVENNGAVDTDEVLQVYVKAEDSEYAVRNTSLGAFKRISLKAGEQKEVAVQVPYAALTIVDNEGKRYVDGKRFTLYVGTSQPDERSIALTGKELVAVKVIL